MALDIRFGDGSPISVSDMNQVRKVVHENMVFSKWEKGDIMCIDNFSTSHGRQPTYDLGRKVLVAWSNPHDKTSTCPSPSVDKKSESLNDDLKKSYGMLFDEACVPGAVEATPNTSPESTLSSEEAQDLKEFIINQGKHEDTSDGVLHNHHNSCPSPSLASIFS